MQESIHFKTTKQKKEALTREAKQRGFTLSNYVRLKLEHSSPFRIEI